MIRSESNQNHSYQTMSFDGVTLDSPTTDSPHKEFNSAIQNSGVRSVKNSMGDISNPGSETPKQGETTPKIIEEENNNTIENGENDINGGPEIFNEDLTEEPPKIEDPGEQVEQPVSQENPNGPDNGGRSSQLNQSQSNGNESPRPKSSRSEKAASRQSQNKLTEPQPVTNGERAHSPVIMSRPASNVSRRSGLRSPRPSSRQSTLSIDKPAVKESSIVESRSSSRKSNRAGSAQSKNSVSSEQPPLIPAQMRAMGAAAEEQPVDLLDRSESQLSQKRGASLPSSRQSTRSSVRAPSALSPQSESNDSAQLETPIIKTERSVSIAPDVIDNELLGTLKIRKGTPRPDSQAQNGEPPAEDDLGEEERKALETAGILPPTNGAPVQQPIDDFSDFEVDGNNDSQGSDPYVPKYNNNILTDSDSEPDNIQDSKSDFDEEEESPKLDEPDETIPSDQIQLSGTTEETQIFEVPNPEENEETLPEQNKETAEVQQNPETALRPPTAKSNKSRRSALSRRSATGSRLSQRSTKSVKTEGQTTKLPPISNKPMSASGERGIQTQHHFSASLPSLLDTDLNIAVNDGGESLEDSELSAAVGGGGGKAIGKGKGENYEGEWKGKILAVYRHFDQQKEGKIPTRFVGNLLRCLDLNPTQTEIQDFVQKLPKVQVECVRCEDLMAGIEEAMERGEYSVPSQKEMIQAFRVLDPHNTGFISPHTLKGFLTTIGEPLTEEEVEGMLSGVGKNKNGKINYRTYVRKYLCK